MNFDRRLTLSSYLSITMILVMMPLLAWSSVRTSAARDDDSLVDEIQVKAYERIVFRDDYILNQKKRSKLQWLSATEKTDQLLRKAAYQLTEMNERSVLAEMRAAFDDTVTLFGRILEHTEQREKSGETGSFHDTELDRRLYNQLVLKAYILQDDTSRLQKMTESRVARANNRSIIITALFVVVVAVGAAVNARFLNRSLRLRLETLHSGARKIAEGNLDFRIDMGGPDEFSDLAETINSMTGRIGKSRTQLEQQVRDRTISLSNALQQLRQENEERKRIEQDLLENKHKLESMSIELSLAEERERDRIAGELHDQVGQRLIFGKMKLGALACQVPAGECLEHVEELDRVIDLSIQDIRSLTFQLRPPLLASAGLEAALNWLGKEFQEKHGLRLSYSDDGQPKPMRYEARSTVFQAAREMLLNTVKHACATQIGIAISRDNAILQLRLSDNGRGFDLAEARIKKAQSGGFGLINVQLRIEHLGGSVTIESGPGMGTCATIVAPLDLLQYGKGGEP